MESQTETLDEGRYVKKVDTIENTTYASSTDSESDLTRDNEENEPTRDNREPSGGQQTQQCTHAVEIHANDPNQSESVLQIPLQTESVVEVHDISIKESQKSSTSIANTFCQQQGIDVDQESLVEDLEAVQMETDIEPDGKQASFSDIVEEEQLGATTNFNQSTTAKDTVHFEEQMTESQSNNLGIVAAVYLNFKEEYSSHNAKSIDLPLQVLVSDEPGTRKADFNSAVAKSTVRQAVDDLIENVLESELSADEKPLNHPTDLEMTVNREFVTVQTLSQGASTPPTKPGQDTIIDVSHSMEGHTLPTPIISSKTAATSYSKGFVGSHKYRDYEDISDFQSSTSVTNKFSQQQGIDVVLPGQGSLAENLFDVEAVKIKTDIEPDGKQTSFSDSVEEEQLGATTKFNQSTTAKDTVHFEEQTTESQSNNLGIVAAVYLNFKEEYSSHNAKSIDLPLQVLVSDEPGTRKADFNSAVAKSTVRQAVDDLIENVLESELSADEKPLNHPTDLEMTVNREFVTVQTLSQGASTPPTKPGQDTIIDVSHSMEGHTLPTPIISSKTAATSYSKGFVGSHKYRDYEDISDFQSSTSVTNKFSQQQGIDVVLPGQGSLAENLFDVEAVKIKTDIEPDGKQTSFSDSVEEEQLGATTKFNQSTTAKDNEHFEEQMTETQSNDLVENLGSVSENGSMANQKLLESEISADERPLNQPVDLEMTANTHSATETVQTFLQGTSTPPTKPGQDSIIDVNHIIEDHALVTPSTSSKAADVSRSKGSCKRHNYEEISDFQPKSKVMQIHTGVDPATARPQESLSHLSRDKESSPIRLQLHAYRPVPVKRRQVFIRRSKSEEIMHEDYINMCLPDSVCTDQLTKHSYDSPSHKPYLSNVWSYGTLPTKRKQPPTRMSKEELRRQYRHRPPPTNHSGRAPPMISNKESAFLIVSQVGESEKSCKSGNTRLSMVHEYEEVDLEDFGIERKDPSATSMPIKWRSQERLAELKKGTHGKSTKMERVTLKHLYQSSHISEINVQLHSDIETSSTSDTHSTTQKDGNTTCVMKVHDTDESKESLERDDLKEKLQTTAIPVKSKPSCTTDTDINEVKAVDSESLIACTHDQWSGNQDIHLDEDSEPEFPERGHCEDTDFVVNEFDTILPELPARAYLEDIDFVSKEFDFFFKRKPRDQEKQKASACINDVSKTLKFVSETNEIPALNSDENNEDQNSAALSAYNIDPCNHDQLLASNQCSNPESDVYVNCPPLEAQQTSASQQATNSSEVQYQPLITRTQNPGSHYDLAAFRPLHFEPSRSPLQIQEAVKSQKFKKDTDIDATPTYPHGQPIQEGIYSYVDVRPPNVPTSDDHYQPLSCKKRDKPRFYVGLNINPQQPSEICSSKVSGSIACDDYEGLEAFPVKHEKTSVSSKFKSKQELRKLYRHRQPPKLPTITDSKISDFQYTDTSETEAQHHHHDFLSLITHTGLQESTPEERVTLPASTKAIWQGIMRENIEDQSTSSVHEPLHSTADSYSGHLPPESDSQDDYIICH